MKKLTLYLVCHTESFYNKLKIFTGWRDSVLTPKGHLDADKLGDQIKNTHIDLAYTSDLTRAKQTLKHLLKHHKNVPIIVDKRIRERNYGDLNGKSKVKFEHDHPDLYPIYHRSYDVPPPGGESIKTVEKRVMPFLLALLAKIKKEEINVLIVAHGNSLRPIRKYLEHLTNTEMMKIEDQKNQIFSYNISSR